jgi:hypothetical protein
VSYITLGSRVATAAADPTGLNAGNWTNAFTKQVLGANVPYFEIYSMSVTNVPVNGSLVAYVNSRMRSSAKLFGNAEWDPSQPILMTPGDELYIAWTAAAASGTAPAATVWLRYDPAIQPRGA